MILLGNHSLCMLKNNCAKCFFAGFNGLHDDSKHSGLKEEWNAALLRLLGKFGGTVGAMFMGHWHLDTFRLLPGNASRSAIPIFVAPAITTYNAKNNPAFHIVRHFDK